MRNLQDLNIRVKIEFLGALDSVLQGIFVIRYCEFISMKVSYGDLMHDDDFKSACHYNNAEWLPNSSR
mgnify:CR=1 FL=1